MFDEVRYFVPGTEPCVFEVDGIKFGINICADIWEEGAAACALNADADLLLVLNASPYHMNKQVSRYQAVRERIGECGLPIFYVNLVGGQDELVFDGASFAMNGAGELVHQLPAFEEDVAHRRAGERTSRSRERSFRSCRSRHAVYDALCLARAGLRDEKRVSRRRAWACPAGIDSALTLAIAVDALGADRVQAVMMPSEFTADISLQDAQIMAERLQVRYSELPSSRHSTLFSTRWRKNSTTCRSTPPKRTSRPASAAPC